MILHNTKAIINGSFLLVLAVGILGSFTGVVNMEDYNGFLRVFSVVFGPLVVGYAGGTSVKRGLQQSKDKQTPVYTGEINKER